MIVKDGGPIQVGDFITVKPIDYKAPCPNGEFVGFVVYPFPSMNSAICPACGGLDGDHDDDCENDE